MFLTTFATKYEYILDFFFAKKCHFRVVWVKSKKNGKLASVKYLTNMSVQEMAKGEPF